MEPGCRFANLPHILHTNPQFSPKNKCTQVHRGAVRDGELRSYFRKEFHSIKTYRQWIRVKKDRRTDKQGLNLISSEHWAETFVEWDTWVDIPTLVLALPSSRVQCQQISDRLRWGKWRLWNVWNVVNFFLEVLECQHGCSFDDFAVI